MKKVDMGQWIGVIANLGVIAGIVLLAYELHQNSEAVSLQAAQAYVALSQELDFRLAEDSALTAALLAPPESRSEVETFQYERFLFGTLRTWENGYYLNQRGALDDELWSGQIELMKDLLIRDVEFRQYWENNQTFLSPGFNSFLGNLVAAAHE